MHLSRLRPGCSDTPRQGPRSPLSALLLSQAPPRGRPGTRPIRSVTLVLIRLEGPWTWVSSAIVTVSPWTGDPGAPSAGAGDQQGVRKGSGVGPVLPSPCHITTFRQFVKCLFLDTSSLSSSPCVFLPEIPEQCPVQHTAHRAFPRQPRAGTGLMGSCNGTWGRRGSASVRDEGGAVLPEGLLARRCPFGCGRLSSAQSSLLTAARWPFSCPGVLAGSHRRRVLEERGALVRTLLPGGGASGVSPPVGERQERATHTCVSTS